MSSLLQRRQMRQETRAVRQANDIIIITDWNDGQNYKIKTQAACSHLILQGM